MREREGQEWVSKDQLPPLWMERDSGVLGSHEKMVHGIRDGAGESMGKEVAR